MWRTTNGGERWSATSPAGEPLYGLHFIDSLNIVVVGGDFDFGSGMVVTSNGGRSWEYTYLGIWGEARALSFRTPAEGWAPLGFAGSYMVTTDSGRTWTSLYTPDSSAVYDVTFVDSTCGFLVGESGAIFKYNPNIVGVRENDSPVPRIQKLHQNYPNPFNPVTTISYDLFSSGDVSLRILDIHGREVRVLVKERQMDGEHSYTFDASGFSSGIYFYELVTRHGTFQTVSVRKLVLLK